MNSFGSVELYLAWKFHEGRGLASPCPPAPRQRPAQVKCWVFVEWMRETVNGGICLRLCGPDWSPAMSLEVSRSGYQQDHWNGCTIIFLLSFLLLLSTTAYLRVEYHTLVPCLNEFNSIPFWNGQGSWCPFLNFWNRESKEQLTSGLYI